MRRRASLQWILARSASAFVSVIRARCEHGDRPLDPADLLWLGTSSFAKIEWLDGRWLVLPINKLPPAPTGVSPA